MTLNHTQHPSNICTDMGTPLKRVQSASDLPKLAWRQRQHLDCRIQERSRRSLSCMGSANLAEIKSENSQELYMTSSKGNRRKKSSSLVDVDNIPSPKLEGCPSTQANKSTGTASQELAWSIINQEISVWQYNVKQVSRTAGRPVEETRVRTA